MELAIFAAEFVSGPANYVPVLAVVILGGLFLALVSTRQAITSSVSISMSADAFAGMVMLAAAFFIWDEELPLVLPEPLFWVGFALTLAIAWPILWALALVLRRIQRRRSTGIEADVFQ